MLKINLIHNFIRVLVLRNKKLDNQIIKLLYYITVKHDPYTIIVLHSSDMSCSNDVEFHSNDGFTNLSKESSFI